MAVDPIAVWGAITGTTGLGLTLWRERRSRKRSLRVAHGWQFVYDENEELIDIWVSVMAWNTSHRPAHIEHVGFEAIVEGDPELAAHAGIEVPQDQHLVTNRRFEIALAGETLEVVPDGPSVKIWTRLFPICSHGIDPTLTPIRPYVVTVPETYWWGPMSPLLPQPPPGKTLKEAGQELARAAVRHAGAQVLQPPIPADRAGEVIGLMRLVLEGDVERTSNVVGMSRPSADGDTGGRGGHIYGVGP
jgi:hypothetical protein